MSLRGNILKCCGSVVRALQTNDLNLAVKKSSVLENLIIGNVPHLDSEFKINLIQAFEPLLRRVGELNLAKIIILAENIASMIEALVEDCQELPLDTGLALIKHTTTTLINDEDGLSDYKNILLGILVNLIGSNKVYQDIFPPNTLALLLNNFFKNGSQSIRSNIINVMIALTLYPTKNEKNQISICKIIMPLVVRKLHDWVENPSNGDVYMLRKSLFLCREVMSGSALCQELFLENEGVDVLARLLEDTELMMKIMDMDMQLDQSYYPDIARTPFSSILHLLDTAVSKNHKVCKKVDDLQVLSLLKEYIFITPTNELGIFVSCIVHILECGVTSPDTTMISEIYNIATNLSDKNDIFITSDVLAFLSKKFQQSITSKPFKKLGPLGTPHPCLFKKAMARKAHLKNCVQTTAVQSSVNKMSYFISKAEFLELMKYIKIYGYNMKAIRKVYPFHKELTEGDLYALWKMLWKK